MKQLLMICASIAVVSLPAAPPANAVATIETVVSAASVEVGATTVVTGGGAVAATGAVVTTFSDSWWGKIGGALVFAGGAAIVILDPPSGTYFNGSWTIHYPSNLLSPGVYGWLGDWSNLPGAVAPPVDTVGTQTNLPLTFGPPSAGLATSTSIDTLLGFETTSFDWGTAGHAIPGSDPLNVFAAEFAPTETVTMQYLGSAAAGDPPPAGSNLFVTTPALVCRPPGANQPVTCGDPEPSISWSPRLNRPAGPWHWSDLRL
jgi:hypothetical protein